MKLSEVSRIKYAIAKELVEMGYLSGVDIPRPEGGFIDVQAKKGSEAINIEVWETQLPEWLLVRVKESIAPQEDNKMELPAEKNLEVPPRSYDVLKMRLFIEIFNALSGEEKNDVSKQSFTDELVNTGKFLKEESRDYIRHAIENGRIFERKNGMLART